jgi:hypothetical protein
VNDFAFVDATDAASLHAAVQGFYNNTQTTNSRKVREFLSETISRSALACKTDVYLLDSAGKLAGTSPLGSPSDSDTWTLGAGLGTAAMPSEVALVNSFQADYSGAAEESGSTRPRARRRGRIYLGPLQQGAASTATNTESRPVAAFVTVIKEASEQLLGDADTQWGVWSRADAAVRLCIQGYVDNAFDTQRRRGQAPTTRTAWT